MERFKVAFKRVLAADPAIRLDPSREMSRLSLDGLQIPSIGS
jgi:hypothetical protein